MQIREYQESDEDAVLALWQQCGLVVPQNDPRKDIQRKLRVDPELFLVGLDVAGNGQVVATVMAGYEGHRGWINYLAVAPAQRNEGLGRVLMAAAEQRLLALGCPKVNLQVRSGNTALIAFYRALGYQVDEVVGMGKRLQSDTGPGDPG